MVAVYNMGLLGPLTALACNNADPLSATALAKDASRYKHVAVEVDSWRALTELRDHFGDYKSFLRPDAPTHFVVITDDESKTLNRRAHG